MISCMQCNRPMNLTAEEALELDCSGIHFVIVDGAPMPVRGSGLRTGSNTIMTRVKYGKGVQVGSFCDLFECTIGDFTKIKNYVEIQGGVEIGRFCKIQSYVFIPSGVRIGSYVAIAPGVKFTNDRYPRSSGEWKLEPTTVEDRVTIGANSTILPGIILHHDCLVGAGSVVTENVEPNSVIYGTKARFRRWQR